MFKKIRIGLVRHKIKKAKLAYGQYNHCPPGEWNLAVAMSYGREIAQLETKLNQLTKIRFK